MYSTLNYHVHISNILVSEPCRCMREMSAEAAAFNQIVYSNILSKNAYWRTVL